MKKEFSYLRWKLIKKMKNETLKAKVYSKK